MTVRCVQVYSRVGNNSPVITKPQFWKTARSATQPVRFALAEPNEIPPYPWGNPLQGSTAGLRPLMGVPRSGGVDVHPHEPVSSDRAPLTKTPDLPVGTPTPNIREARRDLEQVDAGSFPTDRRSILDRVPAHLSGDLSGNPSPRLPGKPGPARGFCSSQLPHMQRRDAAGGFLRARTEPQQDTPTNSTRCQMLGVRHSHVHHDAGTARPVPRAQRPIRTPRPTA